MQWVNGKAAMSSLWRFGRVLQVCSLAGVVQCAGHTEPRLMLAGSRGGAVASRWVAGHVLVRMWLDERPLWLLLDSGASTTLLRPAILDSLGARPLGDVVLESAAQQSTVRLFAGATLRAGSVDIHVPAFGELPPHSPALEGLKHVDGIIGFELFDQASVEIDPRRQDVRVLAPDDADSIPRGGLRFELARRVPLIVADVTFHDGTVLRAPFIFDLGSNADVQLVRHLSGEHDAASLVSDGSPSVHSGFGADERGVEGHVPALRIGSSVVRDPNVFVMDGDSARFEIPNVAGTIGFGVLRHFAMRVDYARRRLTLEPIDHAVLYDPCASATPTSGADGVPSFAATGSTVARRAPSARVATAALSHSARPECERPAP